MRSEKYMFSSVCSALGSLKMRAGGTPSAAMPAAIASAST